MFDSQPNIKRKYELLARSLDTHNRARLDMEDLAFEYGVDLITIKRDLQALRELGVDIHSSKKRGLVIHNKLDAALLRKLLLYYVGLCYSANVFDTATLLLIEKSGEQALSEVVMLQMCIDRSRCARAWYPNSDGELEERLLEPLLIFHSDKSWRLLARQDGDIKQFHLEKMSRISATEKPFTPLTSIELSAYFSHSWRSWIGLERYRVKLLVASHWHERVQERTLIAGMKKAEQPDGAFLYEFTVNSLSEIAGWIVSRGEGITVLEPEELRERVRELALGALANYSSAESR